jgi:glycosyltransferase involved in cell wall biosynthesis
VGPSWRGSLDLLKKLSHTLHIETAVIFTGPAYDKEKFDLLAGADVFIHTSRWEGLPFAVLEAASMGMPCMVTAVADPCTLLSSYRAGIVVEASAENISQGLQQCAALSDTDLQTMGQRARLMIEREFNWINIAEKLSEAYRSHITYIGNIHSHK